MERRGLEGLRLMPSGRRRSPYRQLKEEAFRANLEIPARGLAVYTWGNVSAFDPELGVYAIKPSGVPYGELTEDAMVVVDLEGNIVEGTLRPSSDSPTHLALYQAFPSWGGAPLRGIIHTHSPHAVAWAQACRPVPVLGTTHADHAPCPIPCAPYLSPEAVERDYEAETGHLIVETMRKLKHDPHELSMILVAGHGPFAWGESAEKAVYNGVVLEEVCRMAYLTRELAEGPVQLPDHIIAKHYARKHGPGAYYGQGK